jgi:ubiquinone/menaquinone biosynthesis C-methylase UbiE
MSNGPVHSRRRTPSGELQRIRDVYRRYDQDGAARRRWALDNPGNVRIVQDETRALAGILHARRALPLSDKKILDVGCGRGDALGTLADLGAKPENLFGIDLLPDRILTAAARHPGMRFECGNAEQLRFPDAYFDLAVVFTLFSSILDDDMASNIAGEICRVLKPNGGILWSDFRYNNPWNRNVKGMTKRQIAKLFPGFEFHFRTNVLLPPLARRLGPFTGILYPVLSAIRPLQTHYLGLIVKPGP